MSKPVYKHKALFHMLVFEWFKRVIEDDQGVGGLLNAQNLGAFAEVL